MHNSITYAVVYKVHTEWMESWICVLCVGSSTLFLPMVGQQRMCSIRVLCPVAASPSLLPVLVACVSKYLTLPTYRMYACTYIQYIQYIHTQKSRSQAFLGMANPRYAISRHFSCWATAPHLPDVSPHLLAFAWRPGDQGHASFDGIMTGFQCAHPNPNTQAHVAVVVAISYHHTIHTYRHTDIHTYLPAYRHARRFDQASDAGPPKSY